MHFGQWCDFFDLNTLYGPKKLGCWTLRLDDKWWESGVVSKESQLNLEYDTWHVLIWKEGSTWINPMLIQESSQFKQDGLMVWNKISKGGYKYLHIIWYGTLTAQRIHISYWDFMSILTLQTLAILFFLIQNVRTLTAQIVENVLKMETIQHMEWPVCFPNLNLIEYVWGTLKQPTEMRTMNASIDCQYLEIAQILTNRKEFPKVLSTASSNFMENRCVKALDVQEDHIAYYFSFFSSSNT